MNAAETHSLGLENVQPAATNPNATEPDEQSEVAESESALSEIAVSDETEPIPADMLATIPQATESSAMETTTIVGGTKTTSTQADSVKVELSEPESDTPKVEILGPGAAKMDPPTSKTAGPITTEEEAGGPDAAVNKKKKKWGKNKKKNRSKAPVPPSLKIRPGQTVILGNFAFLVSEDEYKVAITSSGQELTLPRITASILDDGMQIEYVPQLVTNKFCDNLTGEVVGLDRYGASSEKAEA